MRRGSVLTLPKNKVLQSIIIADTLDGDETIYPIGKNLMDALGWLCHSGVLTDPIEENIFEPFEY